MMEGNAKGKMLSSVLRRYETTTIKEVLLWTWTAVAGRR
jgi:hypothetical protein